MKLKSKSEKPQLLTAPLVFSLIGLGIAAMVGQQQISPAAQQYRAARQASRIASTEAKRQNHLSRLGDDTAIASAKKANQRYREGCVLPMVPTVNEADYSYKAATLAEGKPVINPDSGEALVDGQVVCDDRGATGIIIGGVVSSIERSNEPRLWNIRFADSAGWNPKARRSDSFIEEAN